MTKPFYLTQKPSGYWYVKYRDNPTWKTTGEKDRDKAEIWAVEHLHDKPVQAVTLKDFASDFFIPGKCGWSDRMLKKGHTFSPEYFPAHRGRLQNYILPDLGSYLIGSITTKQLDQWLMNLQGKRNKQTLSAGSLEKMITALDKIFSEARYQGLIDENPVTSIGTFRDDTPEREPFTSAEIKIFFPQDWDDLIRIWQSLMWAMFFEILAFCGPRPGEVKAIKPDVWYRDLEVIVVKRNVENLTRRVKESIKTSKRGVKKKTLVLPSRTNQGLLMLEAERKLNPDDLFFSIEGQPPKTESILKHLKASAKRAGVELRGRTTYSFRHSFNTLMYKLVTLEELQRSMGHVTKAMTNLYLHPDDEELAEKTVNVKQPMTMKEAVENLFG